jgi:hypothetical protein
MEWFKKRRPWAKMTKAQSLSETTPRLVHHLETWTSKGAILTPQLNSKANSQLISEYRHEWSQQSTNLNLLLRDLRSLNKPSSPHSLLWREILEVCWMQTIERQSRIFTHKMTTWRSNWMQCHTHKSKQCISRSCSRSQPKISRPMEL